MKRAACVSVWVVLAGCRSYPQPTEGLSPQDLLSQQDADEEGVVWGGEEESGGGSGGGSGSGSGGGSGSGSGIASWGSPATNSYGASLIEPYDGGGRCWISLLGHNDEANRLVEFDLVSGQATREVRYDGALAHDGITRVGDELFVLGDAWDAVDMRSGAVRSLGASGNMTATHNGRVWHTLGSSDLREHASEATITDEGGGWLLGDRFHAAWITSSGEVLYGARHSADTLDIYELDADLEQPDRIVELDISDGFVSGLSVTAGAVHVLIDLGSWEDTVLETFDLETGERLGAVRTTFAYSYGMWCTLER